MASAITIELWKKDCLGVVSRNGSRQLYVATYNARVSTFHSVTWQVEWKFYVMLIDYCAISSTVADAGNYFAKKYFKPKCLFPYLSRYQ